MDLKSPTVDQNLHTMAHLKANTHKFLRMKKHFNLLTLKGKENSTAKWVLFQLRSSVQSALTKQNDKKLTVQFQIIEKMQNMT